jgi:MobA-like NTP transferase domain
LLIRENAQACLNSPERSGKVAREGIFIFVTISVFDPRFERDPSAHREVGFMVPFHFQGRTCLAIVLAAGESSRMRSARPKVLHELAGRSMLSHVLSSLVEVGAERTVVVAGPNHDAIMAEAN